MKETRYFYVPNADRVGELPEEEASHAVRVLRMKPGDHMMLMDGEGSYYEAEVSLATSHRCAYSILKTIPQKRQWQPHFHLAIAPTKMMERMEWMAEKITEVGIDELSFLSCKFSERKVVKSPRIDRILISAVKQSHKAWKPVLNEITTFKEFISAPRSGLKFIAHCYDEVERTYLFEELRKAIQSKQNGEVKPRNSEVDAEFGDNNIEITVLIGPEGDFSIDEVRMAVDAGYKSIHLGESRLRTETAGLSAVMMMHLAQ